MNLINKVHTFIKHWNEYHNPFYVWWKCKDWFRRPNCHIYCGKKIWFFGLPITDRYYNKILDLALLVGNGSMRESSMNGILILLLPYLGSGN